MKTSTLAICFFNACVWGTTAFTFPTPKASSVTLRSTSEAEAAADAWKAPPPPPPSAAPSVSKAASSSKLDLFPMDLPLQKIQGGDTIRTIKMPDGGVERVLYLLKTDGRPLKGRVEMWLGPNRKTHGMDIDIQDGSKTPFRALLKFKKNDSAGPQMLTFRNTGPVHFPLWAGCQVVGPDLNSELKAYTDKIFEQGPPEWVQGMAIRSFPVPDNVESVQVVFTSVRSCAPKPKSIKAKIEVLQGPDCRKQVFDLHAGGGSQPYHAVFETPGKGVTLRIISKNVLEYPFEVSVVPYVIGDGAVPSGGIGSVGVVGGRTSEWPNQWPSTANPGWPGTSKEWWEGV